MKPGRALAYTCEGCETQPELVSNIELTPNANGLGRTTVCLLCLAILQEFPPDDPRVVALLNRIADFKEAWPDEADVNVLFYAGTLTKTEPERALSMVVDWHRLKKSRGD